MSINALANAAVARRPDFGPLARPPQTYGEIAFAAANPTSPLTFDEDELARLFRMTLPKRKTVPTVSAGGEPDTAGGAAGGTGQGTGQSAATPRGPGDAVNTAVQTLTTYIPTEVLGLYISAIAVLGHKPDLTKGWKDLVLWLPFLIFLLLMPLTVWVTFATKLKLRNKAIPRSYRQWPMWEMFAATIAFTIWAFALPDSPFASFKDWYSSGLAGFLALVGSFALGAIAPLMQRELPP